MKNALFLLLSLPILFLWSCGSSTTSSAKISGKLVDGLRILTLSESEKDFTVYRGDYIKMEFPGKESFTLNLPELSITHTFPTTDGSHDYVKMKKSGTFSYQAENLSGKITVMDFNEPHYKEVSATEAEALIRNISPLILDVRTPGEYQAGHLFNAQLLPVQVLEAQAESLAEYKDKDILIYCATGNRSTVAAQILIGKGFKKIYNLRHGFMDWQGQNFPVER